MEQKPKDYALIAGPEFTPRIQLPAPIIALSATENPEIAQESDRANKLEAAEKHRKLEALKHKTWINRAICLGEINGLWVKRNHIKSRKTKGRREEIRKYLGLLRTIFPKGGAKANPRETPFNVTTDPGHWLMVWNVNRNTAKPGDMARMGVLLAAASSWSRGLYY